MKNNNVEVKLNIEESVNYGGIYLYRLIINGQKASMIDESIYEGLMNGNFALKTKRDKIIVVRGDEKFRFIESEIKRHKVKLYEKRYNNRSISDIFMSKEGKIYYNGYETIFTTDKNRRLKPVKEILKHVYEFDDLKHEGRKVYATSEHVLDWESEINGNDTIIYINSIIRNSNITDNVKPNQEVLEEFLKNKIIDWEDINEDLPIIRNSVILESKIKMCGDIEEYNFAIDPECTTIINKSIIDVTNFKISNEDGLDNINIINSKVYGKINLYASEDNDINIVDSTIFNTNIVGDDIKISSSTLINVKGEDCGTNISDSKLIDVNLADSADIDKSTLVSANIANSRLYSDTAINSNFSRAIIKNNALLGTTIKDEILLNKIHSLLTHIKSPISFAGCKLATIYMNEDKDLLIDVKTNGFSEFELSNKLDEVLDKSDIYNTILINNIKNTFNDICNNEELSNRIKNYNELTNTTVESIYVILDKLINHLNENGITNELIKLIKEINGKASEIKLKDIDIETSKFLIPSLYIDKSIIDEDYDDEYDDDDEYYDDEVFEGVVLDVFAQNDKENSTLTNEFKSSLEKKIQNATAYGIMSKDENNGRLMTDKEARELIGDTELDEVNKEKVDNK